MITRSLLRARPALLRSLYLFMRGPLTKRVSELWVYPIKSCAGVKVEAAVQHRGGLPEQGDETRRQY